jgi:hypothetical protein
VQPQTADLDHLGVVDEHVVADLLQHRCVERRDRHFVARLAHRGHRLDVIPVPVRLEHPFHPEAVAQLEQLLVLVGGIEQNGVAGGAASHDEHVVLIGPDHHLVDLEVGVGPVQRVGSSHGSSLAAVAQHSHQRPR